MLTRRAKAYSRSCSQTVAVIDVYTTEKLVTSACCDRQHYMPMPRLICNRFLERLANNGKITTFTGVPLFDAFVRSFL